MPDPEPDTKPGHKPYPFRKRRTRVRHTTYTCYRCGAQVPSGERCALCVGPAPTHDTEELCLK